MSIKSARSVRANRATQERALLLPGVHRQVLLNSMPLEPSTIEYIRQQLGCGPRIKLDRSPEGVFLVGCIDYMWGNDCYRTRFVGNILPQLNQKEPFGSFSDESPMPSRFPRGSRHSMLQYSGTAWLTAYRALFTKIQSEARRDPAGSGRLRWDVYRACAARTRRRLRGVGHESQRNGARSGRAARSASNVRIRMRRFRARSKPLSTISGPRHGSIRWDRLPAVGPS